MSMNTIPEALDELRAGHIIIVVDDPDRENEGDIICAARVRHHRPTSTSWPAWPRASSACR